MVLIWVLIYKGPKAKVYNDTEYPRYTKVVFFAWVITKKGGTRPQWLFGGACGIHSLHISDVTASGSVAYCIFLNDEYPRFRWPFCYHVEPPRSASKCIFNSILKIIMFKLWIILFSVWPVTKYIKEHPKI